ncbi:MAG: [citrate (pro-3S)-lyase] ligase [Sedimentibacter sp.]|uniref:[citrate (pro-3S)-lyase] ligase n=1 Tax=Sedimentibacter sp. TaxID=1960295 RepID=UPI0031580121
MVYEQYYEDFGYPMTGKKLQQLKDFLKEEALDYDEGIEFTVNLCDRKGDIAATGSIEGSTLKCIAVSEKFQGEGLAARIVSVIVSEASSMGRTHLMLFTKPENTHIFKDLGFYLISETKGAALMENQKNGIASYVRSLKPETDYDETGAIVLNCNPFTCGHLYLAEEASRSCDFLHLFVVSEDRSIFPAAARYELVKKGVEHLKNVAVHQTSDYLISSATFPTYFLKDKFKAGEINCILDLTIFCDYFVKILGITKRFVGTEPFDKVTASYNEQMKDILQRRGIRVVEVERYQKEGHVVSASWVRQLMAQKDYEEIKKIVPKTTYDFLLSEEGQKIAGEIRNSM